MVVQNIFAIIYQKIRMENGMVIYKGTEFVLGDEHVIAMEDITVTERVKGYFILNFWKQCDYEKLDVLPVSFARYVNDKEKYVLQKNNIILGSEKDICLI